MRFARIGLAEICNPLGLRSRQQNILVAVGFLLAAVVKRLFFSLFEPLAASFGAITDQIRCIRSTLLMLAKLIWVSFRQYTQIIQGLFQDRQEMMDLLIRTSLAQSENFA